MASLAEAIQELVSHMRTEQQMIREWADEQGEQNREIKKLLQYLAQPPDDDQLTVPFTPTAASRPAPSSSRGRGKS